VLDMQVGASEAEPFWTDFLRSLTRRGAITISSPQQMIAASALARAAVAGKVSLSHNSFTSRSIHGAATLESWSCCTSDLNPPRLTTILPSRILSENGIEMPCVLFLFILVTKT
jgi:hypothetical protein